MIARIWHGWTSNGKADDYERLLRNDIFPRIAAKGIAGYKRIELLRRPHQDETEFITIMWFENWDSVIAFAGEEYDRAYVPVEARRLLHRFDEKSQHYDICARHEY